MIDAEACAAGIAGVNTGDAVEISLTRLRRKGQDQTATAPRAPVAVVIRPASWRKTALRGRQNERTRSADPSSIAIIRNGTWSGHAVVRNVRRTGASFLQLPAGRASSASASPAAALVLVQPAAGRALVSIAKVRRIADCELRRQAKALTSAWTGPTRTAFVGKQALANAVGTTDRENAAPIMARCVTPAVLAGIGFASTVMTG
jgi:hypothetical protein